LILEAVASCDGYIWYVFCGDSGSLNDFNVRDKSSIVPEILTGDFDVKVEPYNKVSAYFVDKARSSAKIRG
jgi:hypothetical protein